MNLYFRLIWTLLRAWWLPRLALDETVEREFRVLPNDIDVNFHMNNGRYLTITDLMTIEFFARTGFLRTLLQQRWHPVLGGSIITYRRELKFGQKYKLRYRWTGSDDHWNYLHFEFLTMDGALCATGYSKGAAVSKKGLVHTDRAFHALGFGDRGPGLPKAVMHWVESEKQLLV
jgi:acyl-CoA thioesterase FadM